MRLTGIKRYLTSFRLVLVVKLKQICKDLSVLVKHRRTADYLSYLLSHELLHFLHLDLAKSFLVATITHEVPLVLQGVNQAELL